MRLAVFVAIVVVAGAAILSLSASIQSSNFTQIATPTLAALAVVVQRINGVQRWLSAPKRRREDHAADLAQTTLINLCDGCTVSPELLNLYIHVWEVPRWFRKTFPYRLRKSLKASARNGWLKPFTKWSIAPTLCRLTAVSLLKTAPTGVRFRKGLGLVGVCIANNNHSKLVTLKISSPEYREALKSDTELQWRAYGPKITHRLSLEDARKLSDSYGQVLAQVVQDVKSGEAIGCVTISVRQSSSRTFQLTTNPDIKRRLTDFALGVREVLA